MKPRLLDLFCGAGGAGVGYDRAGFEVVGVDLAPQPNFPFEFHQADALHYLAEHWREFDAIHASPPCQRFSQMSQCRPGLADEYPDLIAATRNLLDLTGLPYVIENVPGSPLRPDLVLCGQMVGLELYRHRIFESNVFLWQPEHPKHRIPASRAGHWKPGTIMVRLRARVADRRGEGRDGDRLDEPARAGREHPAGVLGTHRRAVARAHRRGRRRMSNVCSVPGCSQLSEGPYRGSGPYAGREVCAIHAVALRARARGGAAPSPISPPAGRCAHAGTHLPNGDSQ